MKASGEISVRNINGFYDELQKEIENHDEIEIDLSGVTRIDLAAAQLIIAAGRKARDLKKVVRLKSAGSEVKRLLRFTGVKV